MKERIVVGVGVRQWLRGNLQEKIMEEVLTLVMEFIKLIGHTSG